MLVLTSLVMMLLVGVGIAGDGVVDVGIAGWLDYVVLVVLLDMLVLAMWVLACDQAK